MKSLLSYFLILCLFLITFSTSAQNLNYDREKWIEKAEALKPDLKETIVKPKCLVEMVKDSTSFQGWKALVVGQIDSLYNKSFRETKSVIIDFGDHYTGHFSMDLETLSGTSDAPIRLKLTFGEVPSELAVPFDPYPGELSRAWLQDEIITIMSIPEKVKLERRVSFRFVKIELLGASQYFDFRIANMSFTATSSAINKPLELDPSVSDAIKNIDKISRKTLKECMQTVYEDGPKRDRRLWVGDLYLESLANTYSFENHKLTQRCLYLLAGLSDQEGYVLGTVFETPEPHAQAGQRLMDYSLLYNATLLEYYKATNDMETALDLWPVALKQVDIIKNYVLNDGFVDFEATSDWWLFFDWKDGLNKEASIQGLMIFTLKQTYELAKILSKENEVAYIPAQINKMSSAAIKNLYNKKTGLFESGMDKQISYASQIWMILAGVLSEKQSRKALSALENNREALYPGGPYMYHYYIQALVNSKMNDTAKSSLIDYWGGMISKGADTFWEVYNPTNDFISPYNFYPVNSYCHAWSCTPTYFIRKYPEIFQK
jgi:hypothetical protein